MYDDVLLPLAQGEVEGNPAVDRAVDLAATTDATLHLLSVVDPAVYDPMTARTGRVHGALEDAARTTVDRAAERAESAGVDTHSLVGHGAPHEVVTDFVESEDIDVVVMATHGREGLGHALLGSVTEKVVRTSEAPVMTVPLEA